MNFRVVESHSVDNYDEMKQDYINGLKGKEFRAKWGMGTTSYAKFLKQLRKDGVTISKGGRVRRKTTFLPNHIYKRDNGSFFIQKYIKGKGSCYYGTYHTLKEAEQKVNELQGNGWEQ